MAQQLQSKGSDQKIIEVMMRHSIQEMFVVILFVISLK